MSYIVQGFYHSSSSGSAKAHLFNWDFVTRENTRGILHIDLWIYGYGLVSGAYVQALAVPAVGDIDRGVENSYCDNMKYYVAWITRGEYQHEICKRYVSIEGDMCSLIHQEGYIDAGISSFTCCEKEGVHVKLNLDVGGYDKRFTLLLLIGGGKSDVSWINVAYGKSGETNF